MRVVIISGGPPWPLTSGGNLRTHAIISAVAREHAVTLSCPASPAARPVIEAAMGHLVHRFLWIDVESARALRMPEQGSRLGRFAEYIGDFFTHLTPYSFRRARPTWEELLRPVLSDADAVVCRHADTYALATSVAPARVVLDADDLLFVREWQVSFSGEHGWGSIMVLLESLRAWLSEQWIAMRCARTLVASERDQARMLARSTTLVRNGATFDDEPGAHQVIPGRVVFIGNCSWEPNYHGLEWFLRTVWPEVRVRVPIATFAIVGASANPTVLPFANVPGVLLAEDVPSVRPWLESAVASVVPLLRGAGTRIKIIDSIGYGTPVVSTPVGAAGLSAELGVDHGLTLAPDARAMVDALVRVLTDPDSSRRAAAAGREIARSRYTWEVTMAPVAAELSGWIGR